MLLVLAFCDKDGDLALKNARLMAHLDDYHNHSLLLCYNQKAAKTLFPAEIKATLAPLFGTVHGDFIPYDEDERKWPYAQNHLFRRVAFHIQENINNPWLWCEADAWPTKKGWLDEINADYKTGGKPFMGAAVNIQRAVTHMSGIAVYPPNSIELAPSINVAESTAWDLYAAKEIMQQAYYTKKIQHVFWKTHDPDTAPTFPDQSSLSYIDPEAVIFHRCKDGSIADRIIERDVPTLKNVTNAANQESTALDNIKEIHPRTIYAYYHPVPEISTTDSGKLIDLWSAAWKEKGWNAVILGEEDAKKNPLYNAAKMVFEKFPSINPKGYEMACWMRWLAMANVGGYMSDFDVFPNNVDKFAVSKKHHDCPAFFYSGNDRDKTIPCFVKATKGEYQDIVMRFLSLSPKGKHYSDMLACGELFGKYEVDKKVLEYGDEGWGEAGAVHFSHHAMGDRKPKWKHIPQILKQLNGKIEVAKPMTTNMGMETAPAPMTIADSIRHHIGQIENIIGGKQGRLISFQTELRKRKLIPQARRK